MKIACRVFVLHHLDCNPIALKQIKADTPLEKLKELFPNSHEANLIVGESVFRGSPLFPEPGISGTLLLADFAPVDDANFLVSLILERTKVGQLTNKTRRKFSRRYGVEDFSTMERFLVNINRTQESLEAEGIYCPDELKTKTTKGKTMKTIECKTLILESPITAELTALIKSGDFTAKSLEGENVNLREVTLLIEPRMLAPFNSQDINTVCCLLKQLGDKLPAPQYCVGIIVKQTPRVRITQAMLARSYKDVAVIDCEHLVNFDQYLRMIEASENVTAIPSPISVDTLHTCSCGGNCKKEDTQTMAAPDTAFDTVFQAMLFDRDTHAGPADATFYGVRGSMRNKEHVARILDMLTKIEQAILAQASSPSAEEYAASEDPLHALLMQSDFDGMCQVFGFGGNMHNEANRTACLAAIKQLRHHLS